MRSRILLFSLVLSFISGCVPLASTPPTLGEQQQSQELIDRGTEALRRGDLGGAQGAFEVAAELTGAPEALDGLGCAAFLAGEFITARDYFLAAFERDSNYAPSLAHLGLLYEFLGFRSEAEQLFRRALAEQPDNALARNNYAVLLQSDRRLGHSTREFQKAFALLPIEIIDNNLKAVRGRSG